MRPGITSSKSSRRRSPWRADHAIQCSHIIFQYTKRAKQAQARAQKHVSVSAWAMIRAGKSETLLPATGADAGAIQHQVQRRSLLGHLVSVSIGGLAAKFCTLFAAALCAALASLALSACSSGP